MVSKVTGVKLNETQRIRLETPGGGGWGDARARDPNLVARDVRLGYLSSASAREDYGVIVSKDGRLDEAATAAERKGEAA
jgi:N-methylhydantoinase B